MTWTVRWMALAAAVIVLAAIDAGPRGIGGPRVSGLFGGQNGEPSDPPPTPNCNGKALYDKACPGGGACGPSYKLKRPENQGAILDKRYDKDKQVCYVSLTSCPSDLFDEKDSGKCNTATQQQ